VVVLPEFNPKDPNNVARYQLGPSQLTGDALADATAGLGGSAGTKWVVRPSFKAGADGIDKFNAAAAQCKPPSATCPSGALGITLDGKVVSAPNIQPGEAGQASTAFAPFKADQVEISGDFNETTARELATQLKYGALPVELVQQQVQKVSPTLGLDALHAGLISGLVGFIAVALYMLLFYKVLGLLALAKLGVEAALLWSFIAYLGDKQGLALTLAGVTGIVVSIGVSLDSNVVYYENLKEDVRNGRSIRSAGDRAFNTSFSTILKADGVSVLGAGLLYVLTVGPVRGFAFYLMLSTALDLFTSYFFMRPVVSWSTKSRWCLSSPRVFGLPAGPDPRATEVVAGIVEGIPERPSGKGRKGGGPRPGRRDGRSDAAEPDPDAATTGATP
jgi:preprotein translocase subunit SecD